MYGESFASMFWYSLVVAFICGGAFFFGFFKLLGWLWHNLSWLG